MNDEVEMKPKNHDPIGQTHRQITGPVAWRILWTASLGLAIASGLLWFMRFPVQWIAVGDCVAITLIALRLLGGTLPTRYRPNRQRVLLNFIMCPAAMIVTYAATASLGMSPLVGYVVALGTFIVCQIVIVFWLEKGTADP